MFMRLLTRRTRSVASKPTKPVRLLRLPVPHTRSPLVGFNAKQVNEMSARRLTTSTTQGGPSTLYHRHECAFVSVMADRMSGRVRRRRQVARGRGLATRRTTVRPDRLAKHPNTVVGPLPAAVCGTPRSHLSSGVSDDRPALSSYCSWLAVGTESPAESKLPGYIGGGVRTRVPASAAPRRTRFPRDLRGQSMTPYRTGRCRPGGRRGSECGRSPPLDPRNRTSDRDGRDS